MILLRILSVSTLFLALPFPVIRQAFESTLPVGIVNNEKIQVKSDSFTNFRKIPEFDLKRQKAGTISSIKTLNDSNTLIWIKDQLKERNNSFEEAFNQLFKEYLPEKEKEFIQNLREVYKVKEIYPNLGQAYNSYNICHED